MEQRRRVFLLRQVQPLHTPVTASNASSCTASASGTVTVNALPTPTVNNVSVCSGATATLLASGGVRCLWDRGDTTATITTTVAGVYPVTVTNESGCTASVRDTVTVNALPTPSVNNVTGCAGATDTLMANGGTAYHWSTGDTTSSIIITLLSTSTYMVTVTNTLDVVQ
jgi:hypothetical protein